MKFEIYQHIEDKSFTLVQGDMSQTSKDKMLVAYKLIHSFESTYAEVENEYRKFIAKYQQNLNI